MPYPAPKDYPAVISPRRDKTLGYLYFCNKQHPLANKQGRVYLHRHALSLKIGRWLEPGEVTHHKDGDRLNNDPENLELLPSPAHSLAHHGTPGRIYFARCSCCGAVFRRPKPESRFCSPICRSQDTRRFDPSPEQLRELVWKMPTSKVAVLLGVSDVAVAKRCKKYGIGKPPRGYWMKHPHKLP